MSNLENSQKLIERYTKLFNVNIGEEEKKRIIPHIDDLKVHIDYFKEWAEKHKIKQENGLNRDLTNEFRSACSLKILNIKNPDKNTSNEEYLLEVKAIRMAYRIINDRVSSIEMDASYYWERD